MNGMLLVKIAVGGAIGPSRGTDYRARSRGDGSSTSVGYEIIGGGLVTLKRAASSDTVLTERSRPRPARLAAQLCPPEYHNI